MDTWVLLFALTLYAIPGLVLLWQARKHARRVADAAAANAAAIEAATIRDELMRLTLDHLAYEMHAQTGIMERAYRGQIERNDNATQQTILTAMQQSGFYGERDNRDALIARMNDKFAATLRRPETLATSTDLNLIINRAWRWKPETILELLDYAIDDLDDSASGIALQRVRDELRPYRDPAPTYDSTTAGRAATAEWQNRRQKS